MVTGAASGIGRALAVALERAGAHLALVDVNEQELAVTRELVGQAARVTLHRVDVSDESAMHRLADDVLAAHGHVELLVNNAGVAVVGTFEEQPTAEMRWLMGINFWGVVYGCKAFLPHLLRAEEGHIVNVSSIFGIVGTPMHSSYCASKFAVRGLSESLRAELASSAVGVTSVHPGGIATNIARDGRYQGEALHKRERAMATFAKLWPPERVAAATLRGVRRNAQRVLVAPEAHLLDALQRVSPELLGLTLGKSWRRLL